MEIRLRKIKWRKKKINNNLFTYFILFYIIFIKFAGNTFGLFDNLEI
jgi:hypothetical protein